MAPRYSGRVAFSELNHANFSHTFKVLKDHSITNKELRLQIGPVRFMLDCNGLRLVYGLAVVITANIGHWVGMSQGATCIRFGRLQLVLGVI